MSEQPMPTQSTASESVTDALIADLRLRQAKGIGTYGTSLMTFNGRDPIRDALEEVLDLAQYLKQIQMERDALVKWQIAACREIKQALVVWEGRMFGSPTSAEACRALLAEAGQS
jgi:hypothetical protein